MLTLTDGTVYISAERLSADTFLEKADRILIVKDVQNGILYDVLKRSAEVKEISFDEPLTDFVPDLILALGKDKAIERAKRLANEKDLPLSIVPTSFCLSPFIPFYFDVDTPIYPNRAFNCFLIDSLLENAGRVSLAEGVAVIFALSLSLFDQSYQDGLFQREELSQNKLSIIDSVLDDTLAIDMPNHKTYLAIKKILPAILTALDEREDDLSFKLSLLLKNKRNKGYESDLFSCCYTIFSAYLNYKPFDNLFLPVDRVKVLENAQTDYKTGLENAIMQDVDDFSRRNYLTRSFLEKAYPILKKFESLSAVYRRLYGSDGYFLKREVDPDILLSLLPTLAESSLGYGLLKNVYYNSFLDPFIKF